MAIVGIAHGAGLALLLASEAPEDYDVVIAANPYAVTYPALGQRGSPWTRNRALAPHVPLAHWDDDYARTQHPFYIFEKSLILFQDDVLAARIPIEKSDSQVLVLSGDSDLFQPSTRMGRMIETTMTEAGSADQVRHIVYPDAGAILSGNGTLPTAPGAARFGGTPRGNAAAHFSGWQAALDFLATHLR